MNNNEILNGENIFIKSMEEKDLNKVCAWKNNKKLSKLIMAHPKSVSMNEINKWYAKNSKDKNQILLGIYENKSKNMVGVLRLMFIDWISLTSELGIYLGDESSRGKGYGKEIMRLLLDYVFNNIKLNRIYLKVNSKNLSAIKLYEKSGFKKEGLLREHFIINNIYEDVIIMGLLKNEYIK